MENIIITKNPAEAQVVTHGGVFHADEVMAVAIPATVFTNPTTKPTPTRIAIIPGEKRSADSRKSKKFSITVKIAGQR